MLFHTEVGLPKWFTAPTGRVALRYTAHALRASADDRYGEIRVFKTMTLDRLDIIEIEAEGRNVTKILYRGRLDNERDLCMAVIPGRTTWTVKTVWVNLRTDAHRTLDRSRYATPQEA